MWGRRWLRITRRAVQSQPGEVTKTAKGLTLGWLREVSGATRRLRGRDVLEFLHDRDFSANEAERITPPRGKPGVLALALFLLDVDVLGLLFPLARRPRRTPFTRRHIKLVLSSQSILGEFLQGL